MAGVIKLQRRRGKAGARFLISSPFDFAVVAEALEQSGDFIHLVVRIERVFLDAQFVALTRHDVDGVVQDALDKKIA